MTSSSQPSQASVPDRRAIRIASCVPVAHKVPSLTTIPHPQEWAGVEAVRGEVRSRPLVPGASGLLAAPGQSSVGLAHMRVPV